MGIFKKKENDENENDDDDELKEESMVEAIAENEIYKEREGEVLNKEQVEKNDNFQVAKEQIVNKFEAKNKSKIDLQKEGQQQQTTKQSSSKVKTHNKGWNLVKEKRTKDINHNALFKESKERLKALSEAAKQRQKTKTKLLKASNLQKTLEAKKKSKNGLDSIYQKWATDDVDGTMRKNLKKESQNASSFTAHSLINNGGTANANKQKKEAQTAKLLDSVINHQSNNKEVTAASTTTKGSETEYDRNATPLKVPITDSQFVRNHPNNNPFKPGQTVAAIQNVLNTTPGQQYQYGMQQQGGGGGGTSLLQLYNLQQQQT